jgi:hypothetical protein
MPTVILKSTQGASKFDLPLPNNKKYSAEFKKDAASGEWLCEVPTVITYRDDFNNERIAHANFAQHLLDSYDYIHLVEEKPEPVVVQPLVVEKKKRGRPKKEITQ